jgi:crossover junction endodeoxyribonuclease RuvC
MEEMKILGIDPGTGRMGWAIINRESVAGSMLQRATRYKRQTVLLACGLIETPPRTPLSDRLKVIYEELEKIIKKYRPDQLAIEELFFVKNVKTAISVSHARGVAMLVASQGALDIFEYKPNEIKMAITGYGHADKSQIAKMLKLHLKGCSIKQDDTADAVAVALCHLQSRKLNIK